MPEVPKSLLTVAGAGRGRLEAAFGILWCLVGLFHYVLVWLYE